MFLAFSFRSQFDDDLRLKGVNNESGLDHITQQLRSPSNPRVEWDGNNPLHQMELPSLLGTYRNEAYGTYELCPLPDPASPSVTPSTKQSSQIGLRSRCATSDAHWDVVRAANVTSLTGGAVPTIGVAIESAVVQYLLLTPISGHKPSSLNGKKTVLFDVTQLSIVRPANPSTTSARSTLREAHLPKQQDERKKELVVAPLFGYPHGILEFDFDFIGGAETEELGHSSGHRVRGFGLWKIWGQGPGVGIFDPTPADISGEGSVKERAEVWFERVSSH
ncbi:hypothetical protein DL93DRAFT_789885 [Clavulina sp. PMI_390]|nr:hypothetical protein DL93DRAFT_789885 [Clavulina sp. PMI_390]